MTQGRLAFKGEEKPQSIESLVENNSVEPIAKPAYSVTPAKAGVQNALKRLDSRLRGNDAEGLLQLALLSK